METKTPLCSETHHHEALLASLRADAPAEGFLLSLADFFKVFGLTRRASNCSWHSTAPTSACATSPNCSA